MVSNDYPELVLQPESLTLAYNGNIAVAKMRFMITNDGAKPSFQNRVYISAYPMTSANSLVSNNTSSVNAIYRDFPQHVDLDVLLITGNKTKFLLQEYLLYSDSPNSTGKQYKSPESFHTLDLASKDHPIQPATLDEINNFKR